MALAGFKVASLILQNGFVPSGEASHAVAGITRHVSHESRTHIGEPRSLIVAA
jgi:hypothetical protein